MGPLDVLVQPGRLFDAEVAQRFFENTVLLARIQDLVSDEHFSVDRTLLEAWASHKSFRRKDGGDDGDGSDFRGEERSNATHASTTDPDARLMRKGRGREARLSYLANTLMENRHGLIVGVDVRQATGTAERDGALELVDRHLNRGSTLGANKGYDVRGQSPSPESSLFWKLTSLPSSLERQRRQMTDGAVGALFVIDRQPLRGDGACLIQ